VLNLQMCDNSALTRPVRRRVPNLLPLAPLCFHDDQGLQNAKHWLSKFLSVHFAGAMYTSLQSPGALILRGELPKG
jgi:hypothetical protein